MTQAIDEVDTEPQNHEPRRPHVEEGAEVRVLAITPEYLIGRAYVGDGIGIVRSVDHRDGKINAWFAQNDIIYTLDEWELVRRAEDIPPPSRPKVAVGDWVSVVRVTRRAEEVYLGDGIGQVQDILSDDPDDMSAGLNVRVFPEDEDRHGPVAVVVATEWTITEDPIRTPDVKLGWNVRPTRAGGNALTDGTFGEGVAWVLALPSANEYRLRVMATSAAGVQKQVLVSAWEVVSEPTPEEMVVRQRRAYYELTKRYAKANNFCEQWEIGMREAGMWPSRPVRVTIEFDAEAHEGGIDLKFLRKALAETKSRPNATFKVTYEDLTD